MKKYLNIIFLGMLLTLLAGSPAFGSTVTLRPNGTGSQTYISSQYPSSGSHYDKVDEGTADDSSTYIYTTSSSLLRDVYALPDSGVSSGTITGITVYYRITANSSYGYYCYARAAMKTNGYYYEGSTTSQSSSTWTTYSYSWSTNPATGQTWTWSEINALEAGVSLWTYSSCYCTVYCTQVYVQVSYTSAQQPCLLASYFGPTYDERLGMYVVGGDINGDGYKDLIIGGRRSSSSLYGIVRIYLRGSGMKTGTADAVIGPGNYASYFSRVAAGDINNDGKDDVVIGSWGYPSGYGKVYIFLAQTIANDSNHVLSLSQADYTLSGTQYDGNFGYAVWVADVDGDNYDDVIVGAHYADYSYTDTGRVLIFRGQGMASESADSADYRIFGSTTSAYFGYDVNAADIDNDGRADVIVSAIGAGSQGKVYIFKGNSLPSPPAYDYQANITIDGGDISQGQSFGMSVSSAGDVDNDGKDDVIIGAPFYQTNYGRAYLFKGSSLTSNKYSGNADSILTSDFSYGYFGVDVSTAGDVDGNGYDDVIIGAAAPIGYIATAGKTYIFFGNALTASMNASSADYQFAGSGNDDLGHSVGTVGDINGDGKSEWFIGAPLQDSCDNGRAYLYSLYCQNPDVLVNVASFTAVSQDSTVLLEWTTAAEVDNEGFNILKSEGEKGGFIQVNPYLIPSEGVSGLGAEYSFIDYNVRKGVTYYYILESIDIYGVSTVHGPVSVTLRDIEKERILGQKEPLNNRRSKKDIPDLKIKNR